MNQFIFILGKNPILSLAELIAYLEVRCEFRIVENMNEFCIIETHQLPVNILMKNLGGMLKIGCVLASEDLEKYVQENCMELFKNVQDKSFFSISCFSNDADFITDELKRQGIESRCKLNMTHTDIVKNRILENSIELLLCKAGDRIYLGKTLYVHNPFEFKKRDIGRPEQRSMYSIPPRLCRIMINLSGIKNGILLDPFCGTGSILQEAAMMGFDVRGLDTDRKCIEACIKNLKWIKKEYRIKIDSVGDKIKHGDARKISTFFNEQAGLIVTEPDLGPALKRNPKFREAERILKNLSSLYETSLKEMTNVLKPDGKIVMVTPCFETESGQIGIDMKILAEKTGLHIIYPLEKYKITHNFPFLDYEERHRTIRQINVMELRRK